MGRWRWVAGRIGRQLWFRGTLFALGGVAAAMLAFLLGPLIPPGASADVGADAVDGILGIIAASMLTVATFSLSTLVAAYGSATANATPRATTLLMEDRVAQNALGTFIGAFLFSLVGIIALSAGIYGEEGRVVLFAATLAVVVFVVVTLLRWIDRLPRMGRVGETVQRVEEAAIAAVRARARAPHLGGVPAPDTPSPGLHPVASVATGYVQHLDMAALEEVAAALGGVEVRAVPGTLVHRGAVLLRAGRAPDEGQVAAIRAAFAVAADRDFGQDPRFGLIVLSEIASRALSTAVNDPGTAIRVIGGGLRVLDAWAHPGVAAEAPRFPHVAVPGLDPAEMVADVYGPVARDGAGDPAILARLLKALAALPDICGEAFRAPAEAEARRALALAATRVPLEEDMARLRELGPPFRAGGQLAGEAGGDADGRA